MKANTLAVDLAAILWPPLDSRRNLLALCSRDCVELICVSGLPRGITRTALREAELIDYFDDILYDTVHGDREAILLRLSGPEVLYIDHPDDAFYAKAHPKLFKSRMKIIHRLTG